MRYSRCDENGDDYGQEQVLSEEVKDPSNNTRVTYMAAQGSHNHEQLYIETEGDEVACESAEAEEAQNSRISHDSNEDEEEDESSSIFEGTEKEEDDISIFEVITQKKSDKSPHTYWLE